MMISVTVMAMKTATEHKSFVSRDENSAGDEDKHSDGFQRGCERFRRRFWFSTDEEDKHNDDEVVSVCWSTTVVKPNVLKKKWAFVWFGGCMTKWIGVYLAIMHGA